MKKIVFLLIVFLWFSCPGVFAGTSEMYLGFMGGWATDQESFNVDRAGLEDWDTCYLYGAKLGIDLNRYLGLEFVVDRFDQFEINSNLQDVEAEMDMTNYLAMIKFSTSPAKVRAYARAGAGLADIRMSANVAGNKDPVWEDDETGPILRFGIGTDMFLGKTGFSVGFSVNYTNGLNEIETLEYMDGRVNICYHFKE